MSDHDLDSVLDHTHWCRRRWDHLGSEADICHRKRSHDDCHHVYACLSDVFPPSPQFACDGLVLPMR